MTTRECTRCHARTLADRRCSRRTCLYANNCFQHTRRELGVAVRPSTIAQAGLGLFAVRRIPAGTSLPYARPQDRLTRAQLEARYPGQQLAVFALCDRGRCVDGASTQSGIGRYVNSPYQTGRRSNARLRMRHGNNVVAADVYTTKVIQPGTEILASYGRGYFA